ncbi:DUF3088 family protein [Pseudoalteromonas luteoviolacea]|uniref:GST N-terminal domain-containing protein n=1 Tax=Pseudoalteromonas luteoviolacea DSM 6061 TaxID=1365250 RepID=A0A166V2T2_9GAMM|nr:DUF3088 family protein [Pseudoalteromonas luteoviolacea]KZN31654.1 hypothetical protein N475_04165 [Pseudoalteromonas luteoviolacea DSM 6061]KZN54514.1 hypothetical protein N474_01985 [Pseudoalteromonas luteoviolacea CPMOR-2]MBE0388989.1 hypothetical protein [Pseudoalteromonas luteoviolacea DSM 6061]TQF70351.1 DUF3088 domain-containing protein [Pseudoalteromonas luteoviolacea]
MKPKLFILKMPFEDGPGKMWICSHCAMIEGALSVNQHWDDVVDIQRIDFERPREVLVELLGEDNQWLPVLILENGETITAPVEIINYLASTFGGAAAHP